jgi:hypothetical protein
MMRYTKRPSYLDRVLVAAAFGVIALVIVFGRPLAHSHRPVNSVTTATASTPTKPVTIDDAADSAVASSGVMLTGSRAPTTRIGH